MMGRLKWMICTCYRTRGKGLGFLPVTASSLFFTPCHNEEVNFAVAMFSCVPGTKLCNFSSSPAALGHVMLWAFPWLLKRVKETHSSFWDAQIHLALLTAWWVCLQPSFIQIYCFEENRGPLCLLGFILRRLNMQSKTIAAKQSG